MINLNDTTVRWVLPSECTLVDCRLPNRFSLEGEEKESHSHYKETDKCRYLIKASYKPNQPGRPLTATGFASYSEIIQRQTLVTRHNRFGQVERVLETGTTRYLHNTKIFTEIASANPLIRITNKFYSVLFNALDQVRVICPIEREKTELRNLPDEVIEIIGSYDTRGNDSWIMFNEMLKGFTIEPEIISDERDYTELQEEPGDL